MTAYEFVTSQGYYTDDVSVFLETKLYDVESEELAWSAQSETFDRKTAEDVMDSVIKALVIRLADSGFMNR